MAWRQSPGGSEQHLTRAATAARTRTQRPGKRLAVHASELVVILDFQILRRFRSRLLLRLEHTHRPTLEDYVHRATRLGSSRSLNLRIGIRNVGRATSLMFYGARAPAATGHQNSRAVTETSGRSIVPSAIPRSRPRARSWGDGGNRVYTAPAARCRKALRVASPFLLYSAPRLRGSFPCRGGNHARDRC